MNEALIRDMRIGWQAASGAKPGQRAWRAVRIPTAGPLVVLAAVREADEAATILFEADINEAPKNPSRFEADGISLLEERDFKGRTYRIALTLERRDLDNIFGVVAADLIGEAAQHQKPPAGVRAIFARLEAWQAFLRARHSGLGREAVIGLLGELISLRRLAEITGWSKAVACWKGPSGGLHDFLRAGHAIEAKTTAGVSSAIEISNLDQLDDAGLSVLLLVHVQLAEAPNGTNLPQLVAAILEELYVQAPASVRDFSDALLATGYLEVDAELYSELCFQTSAIRYFQVSGSFPRLIRSSVPAGIVAGRYKIDQRAVQPHRIDDSTAELTMREMGAT